MKLNPIICICSWFHWRLGTSGSTRNVLECLLPEGVTRTQLKAAQGRTAAYWALDRRLENAATAAGRVCDLTRGPHRGDTLACVAVDTGTCAIPAGEDVGT